MSRIKVLEDSDPLLTIRLKKRLPEGGTIPYKLDGSPSVEFFAKVKLSDPDGSALFTYTTAGGQISIIDDGAGVGDQYSEITMQCSASHLATPQTLFFHLDVVKSGKRDVVMTGYFEIGDI